MALWATPSVGNWADEVERAEQEEEEEKEKEKQKQLYTPQAQSLSSQHHQYTAADSHHHPSASFMNRVASSKVFHGLQKGFKKLGFRGGKQRAVGSGVEAMVEGVGSGGGQRRERDLPQTNLGRSSSVGRSPGPSSLHRSYSTGAASASRADSVPDWSAAKKAMAAAVAATPTPTTPSPAPRTAPSRHAAPSGNSGRALSPSPMALSARDNRTRCPEQSRQTGPQKSRPAKNSPFGEARPREVLLAERGMDWRQLDFELNHRPSLREETEEERKLKEELKGMEQALNKQLMDHEFKFYKKGNKSRERWVMEREIMGLREGVAAKEKQLHDCTAMLDKAHFHNQQQQRLMNAEGGNGSNNKMRYFDAAPNPPTSRSVSSTRRALVLEQHQCNERGGGAFPRSRSVDRKWGEVGHSHYGHELVPVAATPPPPHHHPHVHHYQTHHHQFHYEQHHHHHQAAPPPPMWNNYSSDPYPPPSHHYQNQHPPQLLPQSPIQGGHISYLERAAIFGC